MNIPVIVAQTGCIEPKSRSRESKQFPTQQIFVVYVTYASRTYTGWSTIVVVLRGRGIIDHCACWDHAG